MRQGMHRRTLRVRSTDLNRQRRLRRSSALFLATSVACLKFTGGALAANDTWISDFGIWTSTDDADWNLNRPPEAGDEAYIINSDATNRTISYDNSAGSTFTLANLTINNTGGATDTLTWSSNYALQSLQENIGDSNADHFTGQGAVIQSQGTNAVTNSLYIGSYDDDNGSYTLSGSGLLTITSSSGTENVGNGGDAAFNQTGGDNDLSAGGSFYMANVAGNSTYSLSSTGQLTVGGSEYIGNSGAALFVQSGGTNTLTKSESNLYLGYSVGSTGTYSLSGTGSLAVTGNVYVGGSSSGSGGGGAFTLSASGQATIGGTLQVYNTAGTQVTVSGGSLTATDTNNLATINVTGGTANLGNITGTGPVNGTLYGTLNVGDATATVTADGLQQSSVNITANGRLILSAGHGPTNAVSSLDITGNGVLDLTTTRLYIKYGSNPDPITSIAEWIKSGYNGGAWNGTGIMSTNAQTNPNYGIGYADSADPGNPADLPDDTIEIVYTLLGDANLDGKVNGIDFNLMAINFNQAVTDGWDEGDFNYDGKVNGNDFVLLADNFNQLDPSFGMDIVAIDAFARANGISLANVPEPMTASMLLIAGAGISMRRRRKQSA